MIDTAGSTWTHILCYNCCRYTETGTRGLCLQASRKKHQSASDKPTRHIDVAKKLKGITVHKESHSLYIRRSHNCCKISRVSRGSQTTSHTQVTFQAREIEKHYWQLRQQGAYTLRQCKINSKIKPGPIPLTSCNVEHKLMGEGDATLQQHWLTLAAINQTLHSWLFSK